MPNVRAVVTMMGGINSPLGDQRILLGSRAKFLAHLARIHSDMTLAEKRCDKYLEVELAIGDGDVGELLTQAEAAFVAYGRCRDGAEGAAPAGLVSHLSPRELEMHHWALAIRDKYAGHSVNAMNQSVAMGSIIDVDGSPKLEQIWGTNVRVIPTVDDIQDLKEITVTLISVLDELISEASHEVALVPDIARNSTGNPQLQLDLVQRDGFDYLQRRKTVVGKIALPAGLEAAAYSKDGDR